MDVLVPELWQHEILPRLGPTSAMVLCMTCRGFYKWTVPAPWLSRLGLALAEGHVMGMLAHSRYLYVWNEHKLGMQGVDTLLVCCARGLATHAHMLIVFERVAAWYPEYELWSNVFNNAIRYANLPAAQWLLGMTKPWYRIHNCLGGRAHKGDWPMVHLLLQHYKSDLNELMIVAWAAVRHGQVALLDALVAAYPALVTRKHGRRRRINHLARAAHAGPKNVRCYKYAPTPVSYLLEQVCAIEERRAATFAWLEQTFACVLFVQYTAET